MKLERSGAIAGLVFVVLLALAGGLGGQPPAAGDTTSEINAYLAGHQTGLEAGVWLLGLGVVALTWWFGVLWRRMVNAEGRTHLAAASLIGLVLAGPLALASAAVWATAANRVDDLGPSAAGFYTLGAMLLGAEGFGLAAHLAATNILAARTGMLPSWLVGAGLLSAAGFLISAVLSGADIRSSGPLGLGAFVLWCAWVLGVSYRFWTGEPSTARAQGV